MKWYAEVRFPSLVKMPNISDLDSHCAEYAAAGLPGCPMSVDCVHVRLWNCSANLKQISTGKEKFPSRAYEVMVNHRGVCMSATKGFYGSVSDRSIVRFDGAVMSVKNGIYKEYKFKAYKLDGSVIDLFGAYIICDNGYHKWACLMEPSKNSSTQEEFQWSEMVESMRKDIECFFGILKQIFSVLKYGCRLQNLDEVDNVFLACCAMYNEKLIISGRDLPWDARIIEAHDDRDLNHEEAAVFRRTNQQQTILKLHALGSVDHNPANVTRTSEELEAGMGAGEHEHVADIIPEFDIDHDVRKKQLIDHFAVAMNKNEVVWPGKNGSYKPYLR